MMRKKIQITVVEIMIGLLFSQPLLALGDKEPADKSLIQIKEESLTMKVNFYAIDREKATKGEFVGYAELKEGKLLINVTDPRLEEILKNPYTTMTGEVEEGIATDRPITYQPGTKEHLESIAIECFKFGYIGEMQKGR